MEIKKQYEKIPCPNCANKIIAMVDSINNGCEIYKCQVCKALITYNHLTKSVISIKKYVRNNNKNVFSGNLPNK